MRKKLLASLTSIAVIVGTLIGFTFVGSLIWRGSQVNVGSPVPHQTKSGMTTSSESTTFASKDLGPAPVIDSIGVDDDQKIRVSGRATPSSWVQVQIRLVDHDWLVQSGSTQVKADTEGRFVAVDWSTFGKELQGSTSTVTAANMGTTSNADYVRDQKFPGSSVSFKVSKQLKNFRAIDWHSNKTATVFVGKTYYQNRLSSNMKKFIVAGKNVWLQEPKFGKYFYPESDLVRWS